MARARLTTISGLLLGCALVTAGCEESAPAGPAPKRFAAVKTSANRDKASKIFCERSYASGTKPWVAPPSRPVPAGAKSVAVEKGWRWINFWASWCGPCVEEFPLLSRWEKALSADGKALSFELWSIDEEQEPFEKALAQHRSRFPPAEMHWLRSGDDLEGLFASLGIGADSAIPVHALVDPAGDLRCVRVGSVSEGDYGSIKALVD